VLFGIIIIKSCLYYNGFYISKESLFIIIWHAKESLSRPK